MLSRTAENLFWMTRYMERAETMARLLEVGYRIALMPSAGAGHQNDWASILGKLAFKVTQGGVVTAVANGGEQRITFTACRLRCTVGQHAPLEGIEPDFLQARCGQLRTGDAQVDPLAGMADAGRPG